MDSIDVSKYTHSPVHRAVVCNDHVGLMAILKGLPKLSHRSLIKTEAISLAEEAKAEAISAVINRRDVPNRDTPLQLAVKMGNVNMADSLLFAGADWTLENEQGWNALKEAVCNKQDGIAILILQYRDSLSWSKWNRRLPRLIATMNRARDFYMEIDFGFESPVLPFISKIAPSDTFKIWKVGANLRVDMTLAGIDDFKVERSDQSLLFFGNGSEDDEDITPGTTLMVLHKEKTIVNFFDDPDDSTTLRHLEEIKEEVAEMSKIGVFRPGIDVTDAVLVPRSNWKRRGMIETVGMWTTKVYDMHNVALSVKYRRGPGAEDCDNESEDDSILDLISSEEERKQLMAAFEQALSDYPIENGDIRSKIMRKGWSEGWKKKENKSDDVVGDSSEGKNREREYIKVVRPVVWLSPDVPLQIEELLPFLDIFADKVTAVRRLRDLLTAKLPSGAFPVKVAVPVVPSIKMIVSLKKFEELKTEDGLMTPPTATPSNRGNDSDSSAPAPSWFRWAKGRCNRARLMEKSSSNTAQLPQDPFAIPADYSLDY